MSHNPPLIVIADHDKDYLELMQELLIEEGYTVLVADGGSSASDQEQCLAQLHAYTNAVYLFRSECYEQMLYMQEQIRTSYELLDRLADKSPSMPSKPAFSKTHIDP